MKNKNFLLVFLALSSFANSESNNVQNVVDHFLNPNLNKFSRRHIMCFYCEKKIFPNNVREILNFKPKRQACENLFEKDIVFFNKDMNNYKIVEERWEDRMSLVFTKDGVGSQNLPLTKGHYETMNFFYDEMNWDSWDGLLNYFCDN